MIAAAASCYRDQGYFDTSFRCTDDDGCPVGQYCVDGHCGERFPDAMIDGATNAVMFCGKASTIGDNFDDPAIAMIWDDPTTYGGGLISELGGRVVARPAASGGSSGAEYNSRGVYDLTDSSVFVEIPKMTDTGTHAGVGLYIGNDSNNWVGFTQEYGSLHFQQAVDGVRTALSPEITYSGTDHRWWQLRTAGGTTYFETSPDGLGWSVRASGPTLMLVQSAGINFQVYTYQTETTDPGTVEFDNLNGGGSPRGCP
jgi:hypothetical protein